MPAGILRALLGDMADEMLLASQRVIPEVLREHGYQFVHSDLGSALAAILKP
jgi:NAD dependent epimerase/dehydratase family enzyme